MMQFINFDGLGRRIVTDFHTLTLADGTKAFDLDPSVLFKKMKAQGIPVNPCMGRHELLVALGQHVAATNQGAAEGQ